MFIELTRTNQMKMSFYVNHIAAFYASELGYTRIVLNYVGGSGYDVRETYDQVVEKIARAMPLNTEISRHAI